MVQLRPLALLTLSALLLAGCGSSSRSSKPAASTVASSTSAATTTIASTTSTTAATTTPPPPLPANFVPVSFETFEQGQGSPRGFAQGAHELHVATAADWTLFWPTHNTSSRPPRVDFSQETIVGSFMAQIGGQQHFTQVIGVERDANSEDLRATVREFRLGAWKPNTRILTAPYHLVRCETAVDGTGSLAVTRQTQLDFETLLAGSDSALGANDPTYKGGLHVFRDAGSFATFFAQVRPGQRPPGFDFTNEMIVAVMGPRIPRFGNTVETRRLIHDPTTDEIRVIFRVNPYSGGAAPPRAIETPFQFLRVTRSTGTIRAETAAQVTQSRPSSGLARLFTGTKTESHLVRSAAALANLWASHVGGTPPVIDFSKDQVLIAFEPNTTGRSVSIARAVLLEDDELSVTVNTQLSSITRDPRFSYVTVTKTRGPVTFETVDVTPRP